MQKVKVTNRGRQGDVYLKKVKLPKEIIVKEFPNNKIILAFGEKTGHHHRFETANVKMFVAKDGSGKTYVLITEYSAELKHEEHDPVIFNPGAYEVLIARQWTD